MKNIFLVGDGNIASYLKKALETSNYILSAPDDSNFDAVFFSIADDAYINAIKSFPYDKKIMIHTSGSVPSTVFAKKTNRFGVIYPYQTINKSDKNINFRDIPLFVTASDKKTQNVLCQIAESLSDTVKIISDEQRLKLHLAAVFANNFTNHMIAIAQKLADENNLDISLLQPLLEKTFSRVKNESAAKLQTGPAIRGDLKVIKKHLKLLENHPEWQKIYSFVSESIAENDSTFD